MLRETLIFGSLRCISLGFLQVHDVWRIFFDHTKPTEISRLILQLKVRDQTACHKLQEVRSKRKRSYPRTLRIVIP